MGLSGGPLETKTIHNMNVNNRSVFRVFRQGTTLPNCLLRLPGAAGVPTLIPSPMYYWSLRGPCRSLALSLTYWLHCIYRNPTNCWTKGKHVRNDSWFVQFCINTTCKWFKLKCSIFPPALMSPSKDDYVKFNANQ